MNNALIVPHTDIALYRNEAIALFQQVFGLELHAHFKDLEWMPGPADSVSLDRQTGHFSIDLTPLDHQERPRFLNALNTSFAYPTLFSGQEDTQHSKFFAVAHADTMRRQKLRASCEGLFRNLFEKAYQSEIDRILENAFNLRLKDKEQNRKERWGFGDMQVALFDRTGTGGTAQRSLGLFFCTGGLVSFPVPGYKILEQKIQDTFLNAAAFFENARLPDSEKYLALFGPDGKNLPLVPVMPKTRYMDPTPMAALDLHMGHAMAETGLCIDLNRLVDSHMCNAGLPLASSANQARDAARCLADRFRLSSLLTLTSHGTLAALHDGHTLMELSGDSDHHSFSHETGQPAYRKSKPGEHAEPPPNFKIAVKTHHLSQKDAECLGELIQQTLRRAFTEMRLSDDELKCETKEDGNHWSVTIPYAPVETLLRAEASVDMAPLFEVFNTIQRQRIDAVERIMQSLEDIFGHTLGESFVRHDFYSPHARTKQIRLFLSQDMRTTREELDLENEKKRLSCLYDDIAEKLQNALGLSDISGIEVASNAVCMVGGVTSHCIMAEISFQTMEQIERIACKLEPLKDRIAMLVSNAVALSSMESVFKYMRFPGDGSVDKANPLIGSIIKGEYVTEMEHMKDTPDNLAADRAMRSAGDYIHYFVRLANHDNSRISAAARQHLDLIGSLSPSLSGLILEALPHGGTAAIQANTGFPIRYLRQTRDYG